MKKYRVVSDPKHRNIWDVQVRWLWTWWNVTFVTADNASLALKAAYAYLNQQPRVIVEFEQ